MNMMGKSQVGHDTTVSDADSHATKPPLKASPPVAAVPSSEGQSLLTASNSDHHQSREDSSSESAEHVTSVTSDVAMLQSGHIARETAEKSEAKLDGRGVSCFRDLIDSTIEKTLQGNIDQHLSQTPPLTVGGMVLAVTGTGSHTLKTGCREYSSIHEYSNIREYARAKITRVLDIFVNIFLIP